MKGNRYRSVYRSLNMRTSTTLDLLAGTRHHVAMEVGASDGHGQYGVLDEDADGLLCHECGRRIPQHLGVHVQRAHGLTADEYRRAHGLGRRGLVASDVRQRIAANARERLAGKPTFLERRDPAKATAARLAAGVSISPAGMEAIRQARAARNRAGRHGTVVTCERCGLQFCPLEAAKRRRFCSRSCAAKHTRAIGRPAVASDRAIKLSPRPSPWMSS